MTNESEMITFMRSRGQRISARENDEGIRKEKEQEREQERRASHFATVWLEFKDRDLKHACEYILSHFTIYCTSCKNLSSSPVATLN